MPKRLDESTAALRRDLEHLAADGCRILISELRHRNYPHLESELKDVMARALLAPRRRRRAVEGIHTAYQRWYSSSLRAVGSLLPERLEEFERQYSSRGRKEVDVLSYTISDYLAGVVITRGELGREIFDRQAAFAARFRTQIAILIASIDQVTSRMADIRALANADVLDNQLDIAEVLVKKGHVRAAGALAGVTLEHNLRLICDRHHVALKKKSPTIADFNDALKDSNVIDVPTWRFIQRLGDIRNLSVHAKEREPTNTELTDLIQGVRRLKQIP